MMPGGGSMNNGNRIAATRVAVCGGKIWLTPALNDSMSNFQCPTYPVNFQIWSKIGLILWFFSNFSFYKYVDFREIETWIFGAKDNLTSTTTMAICLFYNSTKHAFPCQIDVLKGPFTHLTAALMSSTSMQTWWIPPLGFFLMKPAMGDFSPNGSSNSIFVFSSCTKTTVTPCSGRFSGSLKIRKRPSQWRPFVNLFDKQPLQWELCDVPFFKLAQILLSRALAQRVHGGALAFYSNDPSSSPLKSIEE